MTIGELAQWLTYGIGLLAISAVGSLVFLVLIWRILKQMCSTLASVGASLVEILDLLRWMAGADANEAPTATFDEYSENRRDRVPNVPYDSDTGRHSRRGSSRR